MAGSRSRLYLRMAASPLVRGGVVIMVGVLAGNLLAALPATVAARTRPGVSLRTE